MTIWAVLQKKLNEAANVSAPIAAASVFACSAVMMATPMPVFAATEALSTKTTTMHSNDANAIAKKEINEWQLLEGTVRLPTTIVLDHPLMVKGSTATTSSGGSSAASIPLRLSGPRLVGEGGGGALFAFEDPSTTLLKISFGGHDDESSNNNNKRVLRECQTLQRLQANQVGVESAERCLGVFPYSTVSRTGEDELKEEDLGRVMIAVEPYVSDAVGRISDLPTPALQRSAVQQLARTLVQMLATNTVTIEVSPPLISQSTGKLMLVDMTEAQVLRPPFSLLDSTLLSSFAVDIVDLIPENDASLRKVAQEAAKEEIAYIQDNRGITLLTEAKAALATSLDIDI